MRIGSRRRLPAGPVAMPPPWRPGLLEAALVVSFLAHAVVLLCLYTWQGGEPEPSVIVGTRVERVIIETGALGRFREQHVTAAQPARPGPPTVARVAAPSVVLHTAPMPRPRHVPVASPRLRVVDVAPPPMPRPASTPAARAEPSPSASPAPDATQASPTPSPSAAPAVAVASPSPRDGSGDAGPSGVPAESPPAVRPSPSPSPSVAPPARSQGQNVAQDARADFALIVGYQNDTRIPRDRQGFLVLDMNKLCNLSQVKPILTEVPRGVIPLKQASAFGLRALSRAQARVRVAVELPGLPMPVQPQDVVVTDVTVDGAPAEGDILKKLTDFIRAQVAASRWLPASDKGTWKNRSEEDFTVEVVQAAASPVAEGNSPPTRPR